MKYVCVAMWTAGWPSVPPPREVVVPMVECFRYMRTPGPIVRPMYLWYNPETRQYHIPGTIK